MGAAACSINHVSGKRTTGDGGAVTGVKGEAGEGLWVWVGGKVTGSSLWMQKLTHRGTAREMARRMAPLKGG